MLLATVVVVITVVVVVVITVVVVVVITVVVVELKVRLNGGKEWRDTGEKTHSIEK